MKSLFKSLLLSLASLVVSAAVAGIPSASASGTFNVYLSAPGSQSTIYTNTLTETFSEFTPGRLYEQPRRDDRHLSAQQFHQTRDRGQRPVWVRHWQLCGAWRSVRQFESGYPAAQQSAVLFRPVVECGRPEQHALLLQRQPVGRALLDSFCPQPVEEHHRHRSRRSGIPVQLYYGQPVTHQDAGETGSPSSTHLYRRHFRPGGLRQFEHHRHGFESDNHTVRVNAPAPDSSFVSVEARPHRNPARLRS